MHVPRSLPIKVSSSLSQRNSNKTNKIVLKKASTKFRLTLKDSFKIKAAEPSNIKIVSKKASNKFRPILKDSVEIKAAEPSNTKIVSKKASTKFRPTLKDSVLIKDVEPSNTESCVDTGESYPSKSKETFEITIVQKDQGKYQKGMIERREHDSRIALRARAYHSASPRLSVRSSKRYRKSKVSLKDSASPSSPNMFRKSTRSPKVNGEGHCESDEQNDIGELTTSKPDVERNACTTASVNNTCDVETDELEPTYIKSDINGGLSYEMNLLSKITEESCVNDVSNTHQTIAPTPSPTQEASGSGALLLKDPQNIPSSSTLKLYNLSSPHIKLSLRSRLEEDGEEDNTTHQHNAEASLIIGSQLSSPAKGSAFTQTICSFPLLEAGSKMDCVEEHSSTQTKNKDAETIHSNSTKRSGWSPHLYNIDTLASSNMNYPDKVIPWLSSTEHEKIIPNQEEMEQDFSLKEKTKTTFLVHLVRKVPSDAKTQQEPQHHYDPGNPSNELHVHNDPAKLPGQANPVEDSIETTPPVILRRHSTPPSGKHMHPTPMIDAASTVRSDEDTNLELVNASTELEKKTSRRSCLNSRNISRTNSRKSVAPLETLDVLCNSKFQPVDIDGEIHKHHYNTRFLRGRITVDSVLKRSALGMKPPPNRNDSFMSRAVEDQAPFRKRNPLKRNRTNNRTKAVSIKQDVDTSQIGHRQDNVVSKIASGSTTTKYSVDNVNRNKEALKTNQTRSKEQQEEFRLNNKVTSELNNSGENEPMRKGSSSRSGLSSAEGVRDHSGTNKSKSN